MATELWFYHLRQRPLEAALPLLLEKTIERGWKAVVRVDSPERLKALDDALWTYRDDSFLPHGTREDGRPESQPIFLTTDEDRPNEADVLFLADAAPITAAEAYRRVVLLFDGEDEEQLLAARGAWKRAREAGQEAAYWQQDEGGRWVKRG